MPVDEINAPASIDVCSPLDARRLEMEMDPTELENAREILRSAGYDPSGFGFSAHDRSPEPGPDAVRPHWYYVEVTPPKGPGKLYDAGDNRAWLVAFENDLLEEAFRSD